MIITAYFSLLKNASRLVLQMLWPRFCLKPYKVAQMSIELCFSGILAGLVKTAGLNPYVKFKTGLESVILMKLQYRFYDGRNCNQNEFQVAMVVLSFSSKH